MSFELLGLSHRIPGKIKNAVYSFEVSALVLETINHEKCMKYANKMTIEVIYSTQHNNKNINRPCVSVN